MAFLRETDRRTNLLVLSRDGVSDYSMQHPAWYIVPPIITRQSVRKHAARVGRSTGRQGTKVYARGFNEHSKVFTFQYVPRWESVNLDESDIAGQNRIRELFNNYLGQWCTVSIGEYEYTPILLDDVEAREEEVNIQDGMVPMEWRVRLTFTADSNITLPVWNRRSPVQNTGA